MKKKQLKIVGMIAVAILALILALGSWHQKVLLSQKNLIETLATMGSVITHRHEAIQEVVDALIQDPNADPKLRELSVYLDSLKQSNLFEHVLTDPNKHEALLSREQQLTQVVKDLLKYSYSKKSIWKESDYSRKVRQMYYTNLQLYNTQRIVNEESRYFNNKITGIVQSFLNRIVFNYKTVIPIGEIVGRDIEQYQKYTVTPVTKAQPGSRR